MITHDDPGIIRSLPFSGCFRLTGWVVRPLSHSRQVARIRLSHWEGDIIGWIDIDATPIPPIRYMSTYWVEGTQRSNENFVRISLMRIASNEDKERFAALQTLPRIRCPVPDTLEHFVRHVRSMEIIHLRIFICLIIEQPDVLEKFLICPGSARYHHSYPGGLLVHSLEVASNAVRMMKMNASDKSRLLAETCYVAGLLHDIGKTRTFDLDGKPNAAWSLVGHDDYTLEICSIGLAYLDQYLPDIALLLRHIWTCHSPGARYGHESRSPLVTYVQNADRQSQVTDNERRAYGNSALTGFKRLGNNQYWRPDQFRGVDLNDHP